MRFFAFGCSFTRNSYPTWADIVARSCSLYQNWAQPGAGNSFIFYSLIECIKRNQIDHSDTVMIMWTNLGREDRFVKGKGWITPGSIYNQTTYNPEFVQKFADPTGYLIRDMAHLSAARRLLDSIGCRYRFFSTVPLEMPNDNVLQLFNLDSQIVDLYRDDMELVAPSMFDVIFKQDWFSRPGLIDLAEVKNYYMAVKGEDWPQWEKFVRQDWTGIPRAIKREIDEDHLLSKKLLIRTDTHPTPNEYVEYLDVVAPDLEIDQDTRLWANDIDQKLLQGSYNDSVWTQSRSPRRFK